jgi:hypothetical protein
MGGMGLYITVGIDDRGGGILHGTIANHSLNVNSRVTQHALLGRPIHVHKTWYIFPSPAHDTPHNSSIGTFYKTLDRNHAPTKAKQQQKEINPSQKRVF